MAHWAEIDDNNVVIRVVVTDNNDPNGDEGYTWLVNKLGGNWIQTSYNSNFRKSFAMVGGTYDKNLDAFIPKKPYNSWTLDTENYIWIAPKQYPSLPEGQTAVWDEGLQDWQIV